MNPTICEAPNTIRLITSGWWTPIAFIGGSLTVGTGSSNTSVSSWRRLFMRYLHDRYEQVYHCRIGEILMGIGAMSSYGMSFLMPRYVPKKKPTLAFIEHCVNDSGTSDTALIRKGIEGIIRQLRAVDSNPDIVLLRAPVKPDIEAHAKAGATFELYRDVARHYDAAVIDIDAYVHARLAERGQTWEAVGIDHCHMNDYGNRLWFECLREWFEQQMKAFELDPAQSRVYEPRQVWFSDELEHTRIIAASKKSPRIVLEGDWCEGDDICLPWWVDQILVGRPGAKLTCRFTGSAIGTVSMMQPNGLKLEAILDGREVIGPYTNWVADFCRFEMIAHGLAATEHVLEITVCGPQKGKNQDDPTARLAFLCTSSSPVAGTSE